MSNTTVYEDFTGGSIATALTTYFSIFLVFILLFTVDFLWNLSFTIADGVVKEAFVEVKGNRRTTYRCPKITYTYLDEAGTAKHETMIGTSVRLSDIPCDKWLLSRLPWQTQVSPTLTPFTPGTKIKVYRNIISPKKTAIVKNGMFSGDLQFFFGLLAAALLYQYLRRVVGRQFLFNRKKQVIKLTRLSLAILLGAFSYIAFSQD
jgi:hypothetical protein